MLEERVAKSNEEKICYNCKTFTIPTPLQLTATLGMQPQLAYLSVRVMQNLHTNDVQFFVITLFGRICFHQLTLALDVHRITVAVLDPV